MGDETQAGYGSYRRLSLGLQVRDDRTRMALRESQVQRQHLESVSSRIAGAILEFCRSNVGYEFHADLLRHYVELNCGKVAPGSPDRVLRDLRKRGLVNYRVVNRAKSLYRIDA